MITNDDDTWSKMALAVCAELLMVAWHPLTYVTRKMSFSSRMLVPVNFWSGTKFGTELF